MLSQDTTVLLGLGVGAGAGSEMEIGDDPLLLLFSLGRARQSEHTASLQADAKAGVLGPEQKGGWEPLLLLQLVCRQTLPEYSKSEGVDANNP